jgi:hypothetical protein
MPARGSYESVFLFKSGKNRNISLILWEIFHIAPQISHELFHVIDFTAREPKGENLGVHVC